MKGWEKEKVRGRREGRKKKEKKVEGEGGQLLSGGMEQRQASPFDEEKTLTGVLQCWCVPRAACAQC